MAAAKEDVVIEDEDDFEIEIDDDTPEQDRGRSKAPDEVDDDSDVDEDELKQYSMGAAKRIKTLTKHKHDERRAKEAKERELNAATSEIQRLRGQLKGAVNHVVSTSKTQLESELAQTKKEMAEAVELGDGAKIADAAEKLGQIRGRLDGTIQAETRIKEQNENPQIDPNDQSQWPSNRKNWAKKNQDWFHKDRKMTSYAYGVHQELVLDKGIKPDTDEYFEAIDEEMRKQFPRFFEDGGEEDNDPPPRRATSKVVNFENGSRAGETSKEEKRGGKKVIRLSASQVALCKRLGITEKEYVQEKLAMEKDQ